MGDKKEKKFKLTAADVENMSFQSSLFAGFNVYLSNNRELVLDALKSLLAKFENEIDPNLLDGVNDGYEMFRKVIQATDSQDLKREFVRLSIDLFIHDDSSQNLLRTISELRERSYLWDMVEHFNDMLETRLHELRDGAERRDEEHSGKSTDLAA